MAAKKTAVALKKTNNRKEGVQGSLKALGINPVKGKNVLIKLQIQRRRYHSRLHPQRHADRTG